jgi:hypothetical protein
VEGTFIIILTNHPYLQLRAKLDCEGRSSIWSNTTHVWSRSTATVEGSVRGLTQLTLSTFPVGGHRRKPTTFGRALTNSFHKSAISPMCGSNPQLLHRNTEYYTEGHLHCFLRKALFVTIRHSASTLNRSSHPLGNIKNGGRPGGWLLLFRVLAEWRIMTNVE